MRNSIGSHVLPGLLAIVLASCSSGSVGDHQLHCSDGAEFCLVSCSLGCGTMSCGITEVAENQRLRFVFNNDVAAASVTGSSFSIRTSSGYSPEGQTIIDGNIVEFVPSMRIANGISTFGFQRNQTYTLSIAGDGSEGQVLTSSSGDRLTRGLACTITATRGIFDQDNAPPTAELIAPTNLTAAPTDTAIILRFSEVIDPSALSNIIGPSTPIRYTLRHSRLDPLTGERECDPSSQPIPIDGVLRIRVEQLDNKSVSVISLNPRFELPGESCVEVQVTADVRDVSGRPAVGSLHVFFTEPNPIGDLNLVETFPDETGLDPRVSGGTWDDGAYPAPLGGDGRHGSFSADLGDLFGPNSYEWNTDNFTIPSSNTISGQTEVVTDGKFYFTNMTLEANETIRFVGTNPAQILVRGPTRILGTIDVMECVKGFLYLRGQLTARRGVHIAGKPVSRDNSMGVSNFI